MAPAAENDQRTTGAQRAKILAAARTVFARRGKAATMADVAAAAGVSQGLAYRYFASKDAIYRELITSAVAEAGLDIAAPADPDATPGQLLAGMVTRMLTARRDHLELFLLLDQVLHAEGPPDSFAEQLRQYGAHTLRDLRSLIVAAQATGEVVMADPDQLVVLLLATVDGLARFASQHTQQAGQIWPEPSLILRMLRP